MTRVKTDLLAVSHVICSCTLPSRRAYHADCHDKHQKHGLSRFRGANAHCQSQRCREDQRQGFIPVPMSRFPEYQKSIYRPDRTSSLSAFNFCPDRGLFPIVSVPSKLRQLGNFEQGIL
jgi:hypothetical protein